VGVAAGALLAAVVLVGCGAAAVPFSEPDEDVRGNLGGYFFWAVAEPSRSIDSIPPNAASDLVDAATEALPAALDETFGVSLVASFPTPDEATAAAAEIRTKIADGSRAFRWGGERDAADDAVFTLGSLVLVTGIETNDPPGADDLDPRAAHPLVKLVEAQGGTPLLEGADLGYGDSSIVVDVTCTLRDAAAGPTILDELGDAIATSQFNTRPPWIGPPPTEPEALARATYRRWTVAAAEALNDPRIVEFADRLITADEADRAAVMAEMQAYLQERGLEKLEGRVDPVTIALLVDGSTKTDGEARAAWSAEVGARMGSLELEHTERGPAPRRADYERLAVTGTLRFEAGRIEIGWLMFGRAAFGLPLLAGYLTERGCDDIRAGIVDFEEVRGD
jgi:hypothetical protein